MQRDREPERLVLLRDQLGRDEDRRGVEPHVEGDPEENGKKPFGKPKPAAPRLDAKDTSKRFVPPKGAKR